jgi:hypothetical protein
VHQSGATDAVHQSVATAAVHQSVATAAVHQSVGTAAVHQSVATAAVPDTARREQHTVHSITGPLNVHRCVLSEASYANGTYQQCTISYASLQYHTQAHFTTVIFCSYLQLPLI